MQVVFQKINKFFFSPIFGLVPPRRRRAAMVGAAGS